MYMYLLSTYTYTCMYAWVLIYSVPYTYIYIYSLSAANYIHPLSSGYCILLNGYRNLVSVGSGWVDANINMKVMDVDRNC